MGKQTENVRGRSRGLLETVGHSVQVISRVEMYVASILALPLVLYVVSGAFLRYVFRIAVPGTIEIPSFTFLALTSLCIAYLLMTGGHVGVDVLVVALRPRLRTVVNIITRLLVLLFSAFVFWASWDTALWTLREGIRSNDLRLLIFVVRVFIPIGFLTLCLQAAVEIGKLIAELRRAQPAPGPSLSGPRESDG